MDAARAHAGGRGGTAAARDGGHVGWLLKNGWGETQHAGIRAAEGSSAAAVIFAWRQAAALLLFICATITLNNLLLAVSYMNAHRHHAAGGVASALVISVGRGRKTGDVRRVRAVGGLRVPDQRVHQQPSRSRCRYAPAPPPGDDALAADR